MIKSTYSSASNIFVCLILLATSLLSAGCQSNSKLDDVNQNQKTIVLAAFGTSDLQARQVFEHIDQVTKTRFPEADIHWAFTSQFIRKKLAKQEIYTKSLDEVIQELKAAGCEKAVLQSLHVVPGQEFNEIREINTSGMKIAVGDALMTTQRDIQRVIEALDRDIDNNAANIIAAHGNDHHPEFNVQLIAFTDAIESVYDNVFVCSVEGQPGTDSLECATSLATANGGRANYIPLMIVSGDHIQNDVFGDKDVSWKTIVGGQYNSLTKSLGYNDDVLHIYFDHIEEAFKQLER